MAVGGSGGRGSEVRAGGAFVELFVKDDKLTGGLERARKRLMGFARGAAGLGAVLAAPGAALTAAIGPMMETLKSLGQQGSIGEAIGLDASRMNGLASAFAQFGMDGADVADVLTDVADKVQDAAVNGGEAAETLAAMGINAQDLVNLPIDQQLLRIADALAGVENEATAAGLAVRFGSDNFLRLLPLLRQGSGAINELADKLGLSNDEMKAATEANRAYQQVTGQLNSVWQQIVATVAPSLTRILETVIPIVSGIREWVSNNKKLVIGVMTLGGAITAVGIALLAAASASAILGAGLTGVATIVTYITAITSYVTVPLLAVVAALAAIAVGLAAAGGYFLFFTDTGKSALKGLLGLFKGLIGSIKTAFGGIMDSLMGGDFELAGQIAMAGLNAAWKHGLLILQRAWNSFKAEIVDGWHEIATEADAAMQFAKAVFTGIDPKEAANAVRRANQEAQKERERFRQQALQDAIEDARKADAELQRLADQAAANRQRKEAPAPVRQAMAAAGVQRLMSAVASGAFQASNFGQVLSRPAGEGIAKQQLAVAKQQAGDIRELKDHVVNGEGGVWD